MAAIKTYSGLWKKTVSELKIKKKKKRRGVSEPLTGDSGNKIHMRELADNFAHQGGFGA